MKLVGTFAAVRDEVVGATGLVPTMGFLHEGHVSLLDAAREENDTVVMSLFVNPLQFDESRDLDRYPRDLDRDLAIAAAAGVDIVFAPDLAEMYPVWPPATVVTVPSLTQEMEGAHRPGHFDGVATVVAKLFAGTQADRAYFGRKDAQQLAVVRAMGRDLSLPIEVRPQPTVREADGLALSSRNVFLTPDDREAALSLSRGLLAAADAVDHGERTASVVEGAAREIMDGTPGVTVEYVTMADQNDVSLPAELARPAFLAVAARVGSVRLIDNVHLDLVDGLIVADRGRRLTATSMLYQEEAADAGGE